MLTQISEAMGLATTTFVLRVEIKTSLKLYYKRYSFGK